MPARGVVRAAGSPETPESQAVVAWLRSGPGSRVIGPRVLGWLGVRGFSRSDPFGVLVPGCRRLPTHVSFSVHRDPVWWDGEAIADGVPVPRPARAIVEASRWLDDGRLLDAIDAARWARRQLLDELADCLATLPANHVPAARVRSVLASQDLVSESRPERRLRALLTPRHPDLESQVWVTPSRRVDFLLRAHRLVIEYDGSDHRTASGRSRDRARDLELASLGLRVLHVLAEDLTQPAALLARIDAALSTERR